MTATLIDDQGSPLQGVVTLTPSLPRVVSASTDRIIELRPRSIQLDEFGGLSVALIPSNESDVQPNGIVWTLSMVGDDSISMQFIVPNDVPTADISQYIISAQVGSEPQYLIGYRGPKGDQGVQGDPGPAGYDDSGIQARLVALENAGLVRRLFYDSNINAYPPRPAAVPAGYMEYVGPSTPIDWLTGDTWVELV
jgi:hypothetical protein